MNTLCSPLFWLAAYIAQHRQRLARLAEQDRAYRLACTEANRLRTQRRMQLQDDEGQQ